MSGGDDVVFVWLLAADRGSIPVQGFMNSFMYVGADLDPPIARCDEWRGFEWSLNMWLKTVGLVCIVTFSWC
jgi:hypothetical protein